LLFVWSFVAVLCGNWDCAANRNLRIGDGELVCVTRQLSVLPPFRHREGQDHHSTLYDDAWMPNMQNGIALHGGPLPGYATCGSKLGDIRPLAKGMEYESIGDPNRHLLPARLLTNYGPDDPSRSAKRRKSAAPSSTRPATINLST
jgi:hypothetical protein